MTPVRALLAPEERSPAAARKIVRNAVMDAGLDQVLDEALLLTTELVTNALVHGGTEVGLEVEVVEHTLKVAVSDRGIGQVLLTSSPSEDREGGRGIYLVDALASAWGTRHGQDGKTVWFELGKPAPERPALPAATGGPPRRDLGFVLGLAPDLEERLGPARLVEELLARTVEGLDLQHGWVVAHRPADPEWSIYAAYDDSAAPDPEAVCRGLAEDWPTVPFCGSGGAVIGAVVLGRAPDGPDDLALVRLVAERIAVILRDEHARVAQVRTRGSLALLAEAGEMFAGTLDVQLTAALAARLVVPRLATWAVVWTVYQHAPVLQTVAHSDEALVEPMRSALTGPASQEWLEGQIRQGADSRAALVPPKHLVSMSGVESELFGECFVLPLIARGRLLGLMLVGEDGHGFAVDEMALLADLSRNAALAMDNARLYEEQTTIAESLQSWLLPRELPDVIGCEFGARYAAAGESTEVGGDFYDVFPLPGGGCGIAIGDVCGKGAEAAAITGIAREVLRLLIRDGASPPVALSRLNETLLALGDRGRLCTVVLGTVRRREHGIAVRFSSAGHPAPVHVGNETTGGRVRLVGTSGSLLGVLTDIDVSDDEVLLAPGESLVLYTDGVTERRGEDGAFFGEDNLLNTLRAAAGAGAGELAGVLESACQRFGAHGATRDDLAVLVVRATDPSL